MNHKWDAMLADDDVLRLLVDILPLLLLLRLTLASQLAEFLVQTTTTCFQLRDADIFLLQQTLGTSQLGLQRLRHITTSSVQLPSLPNMHCITSSWSLEHVLSELHKKTFINRMIFTDCY